MRDQNSCAGGRGRQRVSGSSSCRSANRLSRNSCRCWRCWLAAASSWALMKASRLGPAPLQSPASALSRALCHHLMSRSGECRRVGSGEARRLWYGELGAEEEPVESVRSARRSRRRPESACSRPAQLRTSI